MIGDFARMKVEAKFKPVFVCDKCGCEAAGSETAYATVEAYRIEEVAAKLFDATRSVSNHYMPVGWHGAGSVHTCKHCLEGG